MKAALVGSGIGQSLTPGMHEAEGRALGLGYSYERFDTAEPPWDGMALAEILDHAEADGYAGLNVTHPHKMTAAVHLDALSGPSETLGTVNTVIFRDGQRVGHTTDYLGFAEALRRFGPVVDGAFVVQYGAGGAGSATALALIDAGAQVTIVDPDTIRAEELANRLRASRPKADIRSGPTDLALVDGAVNATPLGMDAYPGMAFDPALLKSNAWVADIVYFPLETTLVRAARVNGLDVMDGGAMAVFQAVAAFELITGSKADPDRMAASFDQLMEKREKCVAEAV